MKKVMSLILVGLGLSAMNVQTSVSKLLATNPDIKVSLDKFLQQKKEIKIAKSGYLPVINFTLQGGIAKSGNIRHDTPNQTYRYYKAAIILTQNLFNGYETEGNINFQKAKAISYAFKYIQTVNNITDKALKAYIDVLQANLLYKNGLDNLKITKDILKKVKELYKGGMTTKSEVTKIESQYYLAKANVLTLKDKLIQAENNFEKIFGFMPDLNNMNFNINLSLPQNLKEAYLIAISDNPAIRSAKFYIKALKEYQKVVDKNFYPKVDLQLRQNDDDVSENNPYDYMDDRFIASLNLTYNIFNGYKDKTNSQMNKIKTNEAVNTLLKIKREVKANLYNAWDLNKILEKRIKDIKSYKIYSEKTLVLYQKEFSMGRRTLLELLTAQNDLYKAKNELIKTKFNLLYTKVKIHNLLGDLVDKIYGKKVFEGLIK